MKKLTYLIPFALILTACGNDDKPKEEIKSQEIVEETKKEVKEEVKVEKEIPTVEYFNNKYEFDTEYSQNYKDGKFELKNGEIVHADFNFYVGGETFSYLSAKFYEGKLVQAQIEKKDDFSVEDVLKELELSEETKVELANPNGTIFDIVINEKFADENIKILPNEWK